MGGLSIVTSGDFAQKLPVNQCSLADPLQQPQDATTAEHLRWEEDHAEALVGRKAWLQMDSAIVLEYSRRCHGALSDILAEMLVPGVES